MTSLSINLRISLFEHQNIDTMYSRNTFLNLFVKNLSSLVSIKLFQIKLSNPTKFRQLPFCNKKSWQFMELDVKKIRLDASVLEAHEHLVLH